MGFSGDERDLAEEFPRRVTDAPISEDAILGSAIGAAISGMRPIIEMQFADFSSVAFNQIVNQAATHYFRTGIPCPIVVRMPSGGTKGSGPFHSQSMEAIYSHYPGLVVMTPATVEDAYSMLLEAIAIDDPVIFCEHKLLYFHLKADALPTTSLPAGKLSIRTGPSPCRRGDCPGRAPKRLDERVLGHPCMLGSAADDPDGG